MATDFGVVAANSTSLVSSPGEALSVELLAIETTDFMPIVVLLEEEAGGTTIIALVLAVSQSFGVIIRTSIDWISSTVSSATAVSQRDLAVFRTIIDPVVICSAINLLADPAALLVSMPDSVTFIHAILVKATDFMSIVVLLEEEALTIVSAL